MKIVKKLLKEIILLQFEKHEDDRGSFIKPFQKELFSSKNINFNINEYFISNSKKNVIRGMHYDKLNKKNDKLIACNKGLILDVFLDIRKNSKTYGKYESFILSEKDNYILYIPTGFAHGFMSLRNNSEVIYLSTKNYDPKDEEGYLWNSFGFKWPSKNPIMSKRDRMHPKFFLNK